MECTMNLPETFIDGFHNKEEVSKMEYRDLCNIKVSKLAFGVSSIGGLYGSIKGREEAFDTVETAIKLGINLIDTSPWYIDGETLFGEAIKARNIPRESFYLTVKTGRYANTPLNEMIDFSKERTLSSVQDSLRKMGLAYADIVLAHDVEYAPSMQIILEETIPTLNQIKESGKARLIGIAGYDLDYLKEVIEKSRVKIDVVLSYSRFCMNDNSLESCLPFFKKHSIGVINAAPLNMGLLTERGPRDWHKSNEQVKRACSQAAKYCKDAGVNIAGLAVNFSCNNNTGISTTLVSCDTSAVIRQNTTFAVRRLTDQEMQVQTHVLNHYLKPLNNSNFEYQSEEYKRDLATGKGAVVKLYSDQVDIEENNIL